MTRSRVPLLLLILSCSAFAEETQSCDSLAKLSLSNVKIVTAATVAAGAFSPPPGSPPQAAQGFKTLPAFCRVQAQAAPSSDSSIEIEVWLPTAGWNGKFQGIGNGGFAGVINFEALAGEVQQGYAAAATNTGHNGSGTDASWALGHPEKVIDFGHRAVHEMTRVGQAVTKAFYGKAPQHSYFNGCSNGGRAALMEAQRYPDDYDGILAGAPANNWTHLLTNAVRNAQVTTATPDAYIPASKLPALAEAVNKACDAQDGVTDGVLNDPRACRFDPAVLQCKAEASDQCLTAAQVATVKKLYSAANDSSGHQVFPGYLPGAEAGGNGWSAWITGSSPGKALLFAFGVGYFSNMVFEKRDWDYRSATVDELLKAADAKNGAALTAVDPNLAAFKAHGGKLILYHGWNDAGISALSTVDYFNSVVARMGESSVDSFVRLYMVSGMQHCAGGPGATDFGQFGPAPGSDPQHNLSLALEQWVESGNAPSVIIARKPAENPATHGAAMTRPLCPYPQAAKYKGTGDTNDAANFACTATRK